METTIATAAASEQTLLCTRADSHPSIPILAAFTSLFAITSAALLILYMRQKRRLRRLETRFRHPQSGIYPSPLTLSTPVGTTTMIQGRKSRPWLDGAAATRQKNIPPDKEAGNDISAQAIAPTRLMVPKPQTARIAKEKQQQQPIGRTKFPLSRSDSTRSTEETPSTLWYGRDGIDSRAQMRTEDLEHEREYEREQQEPRSHFSDGVSLDSDESRSSVSSISSSGRSTPVKEDDYYHSHYREVAAKQKTSVDRRKTQQGSARHNKVAEEERGRRETWAGDERFDRWEAPGARRAGRKVAASGEGRQTRGNVDNRAASRPGGGENIVEDPLNLSREQQHGSRGDPQTWFSPTLEPLPARTVGRRTPFEKGIL